LKNGSYRQKMVPTTRRTTPTTAERFLPPPSRPYHPPNDSYHRRTVPTAAEPSVPPAERFVPLPNGSYRRRVVRTVAERFVPIAERFVPSPSRSYRRRTVRTNCQALSTTKILFPFVRTGDSSLDYGTALNEMGFGAEFSCVGCAENPRIFVRLRDAIRLKGAG